MAELSGWSDFALEDDGRLTEPMRVRRRERQVRAGLVGRGLRAGRPAPPRPGQPEPGGLLHVRPAGQRGDLPVPALGPRARHEQPARLLEHVPRGQRPGAAGRPRHRQGDRRPDRLGEDRLPDRHGGERGLERAADADRRWPRRTAAGRASSTSTRWSRRPRPARSCRTTSSGWRPSSRPGPARSTSSPGSPATWPCCGASPSTCSRPPRPTRRRSTTSSSSGTPPGFEAYRALVEATSWEELERQSGVAAAEIREMGEVYRKSRSAIISWCLGLTQQEHAGDTIREIVNVLLLARQHRPRGCGPLPDPRALQRPGQPHLRHRPPSERGLARPPGQGLRHHVAARPRPRHRPRHPGDDARRREGVRRHGRQLRPAPPPTRPTPSRRCGTAT